MSPKHPLVGQPAPVISLPNADGTTYELKPGVQGKPTAVFFYPQAGAFFLPTCGYTLFWRLVIWGMDRHLWLHERSLLFPGCAHWSVISWVHERKRKTNKSVGGWVHLEKVEFKDSGITVVGIAPNSVAAVKAFATKHNVTVCKPRPSSAPLRSLRFLTTNDDSTRC